MNDAPDLINGLNDKIQDSLQYPIKEYPLELKPLFSAFALKNFSLTTLRSFLLYYLPLLEPHPHTDGDDEDDLLQDESENRPPVDLVTPFYNSVKQIIREVPVHWTGRIDVCWFFLIIVVSILVVQLDYYFSHSSFLKLHPI